MTYTESDCTYFSVVLDAFVSQSITLLSCHPNVDETYTLYTNEDQLDTQHVLASE